MNNYTGKIDYYVGVVPSKKFDKGIDKRQVIILKPYQFQLLKLAGEAKQAEYNKLSQLFLLSRILEQNQQNLKRKSQRSKLTTRTNTMIIIQVF